MKTILLLIFFCQCKIALSQFHNDGLQHDDKYIKLNKVKEFKTYYYNSNRDSILYYSNCYDSFGNILSRITYTKKGKIEMIDTFLYNSRNLLLKKWRYYAYNKTIDEGINTYDENGKAIRFDFFSNDTLVYYSFPKYSEEDSLIGNEMWDGKTDSLFLVTNRFYDKKTGQKKLTMIGANGDTTSSIFEFDSLGNIASKIEKSSRGIEIWRFDMVYNSACNYTEVITVNTANNKRVNRETYVYYPNCLVYERVTFYEKTKSKWRSFYTYY